MRKLLLLSFLFCLSQIANAQFPGMGGVQPSIKGKIQGKVIDADTGEAVPYASVALLKAGTEIILDGAISEENGKFKFEKISTGKYDLTVSFLGYEDKAIAVETTLKSPDKNVGKIMLSAAMNVIDEVKVTAKRALIENKVDKIVFNAEDDSSVAGGDATEVLRKVPMLSVDAEGNVSLRGSQDIKILVNGKPSGMFASSPKEALKMFPADQIKKVEVITSPSAKYDAEGAGGIINIITKEKNMEGVAGSLGVSLGNRQSTANASINAGKGRFGLSSNAVLFYMPGQDADNTFELRQLSDNAIQSSYEGKTKTSRLGGQVSVSAFYDFNAYHSINSSISGRGFTFGMDSDINGINNLGIPNTYTRTGTSDNLWMGIDWSTDYTMKFPDKKDQELVLAVQYSNNQQDQDFDNEIITKYASSVDSLLSKNSNDGTNHEYTLQADYTHPLSKNVKLETGAKGVLRDIKSTYTEDIFNYDQDVIAGYSSLNFKFAKKYSVIAGLRYEHTNIKGEYKNGGADAFSNSYENWLPNLTISRQMKNFKTLNLSYSQRIQRPSLQFINPFSNSNDQNNITRGNPELKPEINHQIEVGYNFNILKAMVFANGYYKRTNDVIQSYFKDNGAGVTETNFDNVGTLNAYGVNIFTSKNFNKLSLRGGGDVYYFNGNGIVNNEKISADGVQYRLFFNGDYKITKTIKADFFGFFNSSRQTLQGSNPSFSIMGFGIRKEFDNWSIGIKAIEPFNATKSFNSNLIDESLGLQRKTTFEIPFRSFGIDVSYKFGKVDFKKRNSKVKNSDIKQGEQGGQQGGM